MHGRVRAQAQRRHGSVHGRARPLGVRLHLADDGRVYCGPCFAAICRATRAAELAEVERANAEHFAQDSLFAL